MAYEGHCGKCIEYEFKADNQKGYCEWYRTYYYPDDGVDCIHQKDRYEKNPGGNCYLTTIICDILGYDDDCFVLNTLRNFRNNIMQKDKKYKNLLIEYDTIGPQIAKCIKEDNQNSEVWTQIYNSYLIPTTTDIMDKKYEKATNRYKEMYFLLKDYYAIEDIDIEKIKENYDQRIGGHGKIKRKIQP